MNTSPLLEVNQLAIEFKTERGLLTAVRDVSFTLNPGETLGIVGESGCGKTVTGLSIMGLLPKNISRISRGSISFGEYGDLSKLSTNEFRKLRGRDISMIFQEPMTALNPVFTIETQLTDVLRRHQNLSKKQAYERALEALALVRIPSPKKRIKQYPHEFSGGMRQRVMIAMAMACQPKLLIADEPTTALDVTTQAQVLLQMKELQKKFSMGLIMVTHDLGVVAQTCEKMMVMYCGRVIEIGATKDIINNPQHPYTKGLLDSIPRIRKDKVEKLPTIEGMVPPLFDLPPGCAYQNRCPNKNERCEQERPSLQEYNSKRKIACFSPLGGLSA